MQINIPIKLDVQSSSPVRQYLTARQGDGGLYHINVALLSGGLALCIPKTATAVLNCAKPDGTYTETSGNICRYFYIPYNGRFLH